MPVTFLLDENVPGRIWRAIQRHNEDSVDILDVVRVGQPDDLPLSADDRSILLWAERQGRILITEDKNTRTSGDSSPRGTSFTRYFHGAARDPCTGLVGVAGSGDASQSIS